MALLTGRAYRRRKKEVIFVDGVNINSANDLVPGLDRADETFHVYGDDSPQTDVQHNYGSLQIGILAKGDDPNDLLDVVTGQLPGGSAHKQYRVEDLVSCDAWMNVKNLANSQYKSSLLYAGWTPGMPVPSGAPNDKAVYTVSGNSELPRQFHGVWITAKKVASGASPTLGATPVSVPRESGIYAVRFKALDLTGGVFVKEQIIPITATLVTSTGTIAQAEVNAAATDLAAVTHMYVLFLQSGTGVYPANAPDKLRV